MRSLLFFVALAGMACSAEVRSGLPPLVEGCRVTSDCSAAGPQFVCVDGGCEILACTCDIDCADAGLLCHAFSTVTGSTGYQCLQTDTGTPCGGG